MESVLAPGQLLDRNTAITAMILADTAADEHVHQDHRLWPHIHGWAAELGLTGPQAVAAAAQPTLDSRHNDQKFAADCALSCRSQRVGCCSDRSAGIDPPG
jgi:hypothetical protein